MLGSGECQCVLIVLVADVFSSALGMKTGAIALLLYQHG